MGSVCFPFGRAHRGESTANHQTGTLSRSPVRSTIMVSQRNNMECSVGSKMKFRASSKIPSERWCDTCIQTVTVGAPKKKVTVAMFGQRIGNHSAKHILPCRSAGRRCCWVRPKWGPPTDNSEVAPVRHMYHTFDFLLRNKLDPSFHAILAVKHFFRYPG